MYSYSDCTYSDDKNLLYSQNTSEVQLNTLMVSSAFILIRTLHDMQRAAFLLFARMKVELSLCKPSVDKPVIIIIVVVVFGTHYWTTYYISTKICCLSIIVKFGCRTWVHETPLITSRTYYSQNL